MATLDTGQRQYCFGEFTLDVARGALRRGSDEVKLRRQSFEVLRYLVERPGRLVTKAELLDSVWGETVVTDGSLTQCLIDVRRVLGDEARQTIRTIPRRGYVFEAPVTESALSPGRAIHASRPARRADRWPVAAGAVLLLAAAMAWWLLSFDSPAGNRFAARANYIAVLPFDDMSEAQDHRYFSDGISEEILNLLAQSPDLHVIARTSSFSFRGQNVDIATIAEQLNVSYLLQGSVRRSDNRVRITAQLIDTATSTEVWSDTYDRELGDVLMLQSEIAAAVAIALQATLALDRVTGHAGPANQEAYEAFLQGRFFHNRRAEGDIQRAEEYFRRALGIDPAYGRAWAGLAGIYFVRLAGNDDASGDTAAAWQTAVEQALRYAPEDSEVELRAAQYYWVNGDAERADGHLRKATLLGRNNPLVMSALAGISAHHGRLEEAITRQRQAVDLNPLAAINHGNLASMLAAAGRFEEALAEERKALDLNPSYRKSFEWSVAAIFIAQGRFEEALEIVQDWKPDHDRDRNLAMIYHGLGRSGDANAALDRLLERPGPSAALSIAEVYAYFGDVSKSFRWLEAGLDGNREWDRYMRVHDARISPFLIVLRDDARWEQILEPVGHTR